MVGDVVDSQALVLVAGEVFAFFVQCQGAGFGWGVDFEFDILFTVKKDEAEIGEVGNGHAGRVGEDAWGLWEGGEDFDVVGVEFKAIDFVVVWCNEDFSVQIACTGAGKGSREGAGGLDFLGAAEVGRGAFVSQGNKTELLRGGEEYFEGREFARGFEDGAAILQVIDENVAYIIGNGQEGVIVGAECGKVLLHLDDANGFGAHGVESIDFARFGESQYEVAARGQPEINPRAIVL